MNFLRVAAVCLSSILLTTMLLTAQPSLALQRKFQENHWLVGHWKLIGYIYQGQFNPPITPNLLLTFMFQEDGVSQLYWTRTGEPGFCERKGQYSVNKNLQEHLFDEVTWVNPRNNIDCGQDPDMQKGKKSINEISLVNEKFHLEIGLAGEPFTYVFERLPQSGDPRPSKKSN